MAEVHQSLGIYQRKTTPYHLQTNGAVERFNRTLQNMIAMYVNAYQDDWDEILPYVLYAYRTAYNESTRESPYYLMFIRDPINPTDLQEIQAKLRTLTFGVTNKAEEAIVAHQKVLEYDLQSKVERDLKSTVKENPFKMGDLVLMYQPQKKQGLTSKWMYPWRGPFRIIQLKDKLVKLKSYSGKVVDHMVNINSLKIYKKIDPKLLENSPIPMEVVPAETQELEDWNPEWEIDKIKESKKEKEGDKFLIKWKGYSDKFNTWEPRENLEHSLV